MVTKSGRPSPVRSPTGVRAASHRLSRVMLNATSRTLSARKLQVTRPLAPATVAFPAPKSAAVSTCTVLSLCIARRLRGVGQLAGAHHHPAGGRVDRVLVVAVAHVELGGPQEGVGLPPDDVVV